MESLHQAVSTIGCFDFYVALFLCGIDTERHGPDWHSVAVSGNVFYPRTLVHAMPDIDGDNFGVAEVKCYDPLDCSNKCAILSKTSRQGTGTPAACQMCEAPCPSNVLKTLTSIKIALKNDILQVLRIAAVCLGGGGFQKCIVCAVDSNTSL
jgi:hypothetical protein